MSNDNSSSDTSGSDRAGSGGSSSSGSSSGSTGTATSSGAAAAATSTAPTTLAKWNLTDSNNKMYGVSLGNWLVIERWMDEDWMVQTGGSDAWDEWTLTENLGSDAASVLTEHWNSWITEEELDTFKSAGMNHVRIPVGYWAFIPAASGEPYLAMSGQTDQLTKMLGWLNARGMYASIDLHGMPGSQNGDQASGHNTSKVEWFTDTNQQLSYQTLNATIAYIKASEYASTVSSIGVVNEPRPSHYSFSSSEASANWDTLENYYETAYQICLEAEIPMLFHHGFWSGSGTPANHWRSFATGKNPNYLGYEDHPYPGWFTPQNNSESYMKDNACDIIQGAVGYPVPMLITEWSSINGVYSDSWTQQWTNIQLAGYAWSGGSIFWSGKVMNSTTQILSLPNELQMLYSGITLIQAGILPIPSSSTESNVDFLSSLSGANGCGTFQTDTWTNPSTSGSSYNERRSLDDRSLGIDSASLLKKRLQDSEN
ncbi:glycoside hydrolase [Microstroma glucosiphilum]|uniref:glucan 1,3-beta-glucosidase n=1 Tax=Pseudomicrostroma glucosiphilum TaxID=1684307 RepID=A0A316UID7_9BASI|nr:glycoside hydrolase [Pseudomicrostroma glucosiphilum]PWN23703.1 glycoside hydrolase [Pseudomicrostroma glucosiphilum]